jgi:hypothetical protein
LNTIALAEQEAKKLHRRAAKYSLPYFEVVRAEINDCLNIGHHWNRLGVGEKCGIALTLDRDSERLVYLIYA